MASCSSSGPTTPASTTAQPAQDVTPAALEHAVRHRLGDDDIWLKNCDAPTRKFVLQTPGAVLLPGSISAAAADVVRSTAYLVIAGTAETDVSAMAAKFTTKNVEELLREQFIPQTADEDICLLFDRDIGIFETAPSDGNCEVAAKLELWEGPDGLKYNEALTEYCRSMVVGEKSVFLRVQEISIVATTLMCKRLYQRMRLRLPHAVSVVESWPSYDPMRDEIKYNEYTGDAECPETRRKAGFLFSDLQRPLDSRTPRLLSLVHLKFIYKGVEHQSAATVGCGLLNPWLESALMALPVDIHSFLILPSDEPDAISDPLLYSGHVKRTALHDVTGAESNASKSETAGINTVKTIVTKDVEHLFDEALLHSTRFFAGDEGSCLPGPFTLLEPSDKMMELLPTQCGLILRDLVVTKIELLPDVRSFIYDQNNLDCDTVEVPAASAAVCEGDVPDTLSEDPEEQDEVEVPDSIMRVRPPLVNPDSTDYKLRFIETAAEVAAWLFRRQLFFDALRMYDYASTNLETLRSNKKYELRLPCRRAFELEARLFRNIAVCLHRLGEYHHGHWLVQERLIQRHPDNACSWYWLARHESGLGRADHALQHLKVALAMVSDLKSADARLMQREITRIRRELRQSDARLKLPENGGLYADIEPKRAEVIDPAANTENVSPEQMKEADQRGVQSDEENCIAVEDEEALAKNPFHLFCQKLGMDCTIAT